MEKLLPKSEWGPGPWQSEPDRAEWRHAGMPCLAVRNTRVTGAWCGYVGVPPGHPLYKKDYHKCDSKISVHGGLTYSDHCRDHICHVPKPGEPDKVWWLGFDCSHVGDISPMMDATTQEIYKEMGRKWREFPLGGTYKTLAYVRKEVNRLARQLRRLVRR